MPSKRDAWLWLLLALVCVVALLRKFSDPDIWFHLTIGREILNRQALPPFEFYVFPSIGEPAHFPAAGYGLLQYLLFSLAGLPALAVFNAVIFAATLYLLARAASVACAGARLIPLLLALSITLWGLNPRFVYRPENLLFLFLAIEFLLLESWLRNGRLGQLLVLPVLTWGITMMHTTWILLVLAYGAYVVDLVVQFLRQPAAERLPSARRLHRRQCRARGLLPR